MRSIIYLFSIGLILAVSCEKETETFDESRYGYDYFPLEVGKTWIYQVDSTIYDDDGTSVFNISSEVKEEIVEKYEDETGEEIYRVERFWRSSDSMEWLVTDVWTASMDGTRAFRTEENLKFIKLVFPALEGKNWNGNIYFDESTTITVYGEDVNMFIGWDNYELESVDLPEEIGGNSYNQVATVLLTDDRESNFVERRYALEKYARGVGLVYKHYIILDTQKSDSNLPWEEKAEKGFILKQTLIEHN